MFGSLRNLWMVAIGSLLFFLAAGAVDADQHSKIAFSSLRDGNFGIYVMDADGSNVTRLTTNSSGGIRTYKSLSWSPDGSQIAFVADNCIYVMDAGGSNLMDLAACDCDGLPIAFSIQPRWSPDGSQIAFTSCGEIYVMDADGSNQMKLANSSLSLQLEWSPDGSQIAFIDCFETGSNPSGVPIFNCEISVVDAIDGSNPIRLTDNPALDGDPSWSPDGSQIAFQSNRDGNGEIYGMDADGSNQTNLTNSPRNDCCTTWSPDGTQIYLT